MYDSILALRALRSFTDDPVSDADLDRLLEALRWTGSSKNRQAWSWVVIREAAQRERLAACGDFTQPVLAAPLVIAIVQEPEGYEFDSGRLAQNLMLAADAIGLGSCPITLHRDADAAVVLDLPEGRRCRYAVVIGHPAPGSAPARFGGRKPVDDLTHHERYGS